MNTEALFLGEPELEFGNGYRHIDIRFGLMNYGPLDVNSELAPKRIRVGLVGLPQNVEGLRDWLLRCREELPGKASRLANLFPKFPGFRDDVAFRSSLVLESRLERHIREKDIKELQGRSSNSMISTAVDIFCEEFSYLLENRSVDVFLCAVPSEIEDLMDPEARSEDSSERPLDFHDMLKAKAMSLGIPVQLVLAGTYNPSARKRQKIKSERLRQLQDEATRAWNLHTALYYKAKGLPWRLTRDPAQLTSCYIGISFYRSLDLEKLMTSMAQVFDERGDGIVIRGGPVKLSKDDRIPHLSSEDAFFLLSEALGRYRDVHRTLPARIVVHKTSEFDAAELAGFLDVAKQRDIGAVDFLSFSAGGAPRLFRVGPYPPLRGTMLSLDARSHVLYTRGSVDFYSTYPGMYVPNPLLFRCDHVEQTPKFLAKEVLALSKMNWNDTKFDGSAPITITAAKRVGSILKYVEEGERIAPRYSYYM